MKKYEFIAKYGEDAYELWKQQTTQYFDAFKEALLWLENII